MSHTPGVNPGLRERAGRWIESGPVQRVIVALILINAAILGLETDPDIMARIGDWLIGADRVILGVFVVEILIKLYAQGLRFFRNPWNVFDFFVVGIALFPASGPFAVLRILRLLRLVSMVPKLRFVVEALLRAIPGIASIFGLLIILFYVFAVIATNLFAEQHPDWFGSIGRSMYTLFQVMTLESWSMGIARPVMETHPYAWVFFVPFILVATFTILNLFIAIIVNTMQTLAEEQQRFEEKTITTVVHAESEQLHQDLTRVESENQQLHQDLRALREEIRALREELRRPG
ncbi:ion transporter [Thioalkalivibrio sulfidiphilus]|uniref:ion transporter n=1 Tax=Thioalkalivibrio sulfidiphilus TaxID=1033854 RepID=UPI00038203FC|nr:ion transporter [Thioalkalivibrio sulfidiphilus]